MSDHLSGRVALLAEIARSLDPALIPVRVTFRERAKVYIWLWRLRRRA